MSGYIKYPEEVKMDVIKRRMKPVCYVSPNFIFIGTPDEYYSWDSIEGYIIKGRIEVMSYKD